MFKAFFFIPLIYITGVMTAVGFFFNSNTLQATNEPPFWLLGAFAVIIPLHLFSMFCIFYCLYFVAKTIKTVELQREVTFSDFIGEFFLVWFHLIGVWILQPRINKFVQNNDENLQTEPSIN